MILLTHRITNTAKTTGGCTYWLKKNEKNILCKIILKYWFKF
jgi:hypothetical protein